MEACSAPRWNLQIANLLLQNPTELPFRQSSPPHLLMSIAEAAIRGKTRSQKDKQEFSVVERPQFDWFEQILLQKSRMQSFITAFLHSNISSELYQSSNLGGGSAAVLVAYSSMESRLSWFKKFIASWRDASDELVGTLAAPSLPNPLRTLFEPCRSLSRRLRSRYS